MSEFTSEALINATINSIGQNGEFGEVTDAPTVKLLLNFVEPVSVDAGCVEVLNRFINDKMLVTAAVVDRNRRPVGIMDRGRMTEIFIKPYARDLHHKKKITEIMDSRPIVVDAGTGIDDVARMIIDSGMHHMMQGFIIVNNGVYAGIATGHALLEEITQRKQRDLYYLAHYDQLTGLANRLLFMDRLQLACQTSERSGKTVALIFIDLDRFKFINDSLGHDFADQLLITIANRLRQCVRKSDTVARLGGDEFVVILQHLDSEHDTDRVASNIVDAIRQTIKVAKRTIHITASLGIALFPKHGKNPDELIRKADAAMYAVKKRGRNGHLIYLDSFDQGMSERIVIESWLKSALRNRELSLFYQPQIHLSANKVIGVEALLRWSNPELGNVPPVKFIPIAEEAGFIHDIGEWVLQEACRQHNDWLAQGLPPLRIAVNISPTQFLQDDFSEQVYRIIQVAGVDPQFIELELTESMVMVDAEHTLQMLSKLRSFGIKLAIDDFGTGYSSLEYLRKFPVDRIKIDQTFIRNIRNIPANDAIVRAIITMGESLGLGMVAEGVETAEELECVKGHQCQEVQGYHFSCPIPAEQFSVWYQNFGKSNT